MRFSLAILCLVAFVASGEIVTNISNAVTVKRWERHYIYGFADGTLHDPSGKIASKAHAAGIEASIKSLTEIAEDARRAAAQNLERMYAVTNLIDTFTRKIFVQATLYPQFASFSNCWGRVASEWTDGTNDICMVYLSREFKVPPVIKRRYITELSTNLVEGVWTDFSASGQIVDGYEGCKEIRFKRPEGVTGKNCFSRQYLKFGIPGSGFDFGTRVFAVDGEIYYTGTWTNALGKIWRFNNGVNVTEEEVDVQ